MILRSEERETISHNNHFKDFPLKGSTDVRLDPEWEEVSGDF